MTDEFVIGIDSSTQSTKAVAWNRSGEALAEGRAGIAMTSPRPGWFEQDPSDWWASACAALQALGQQIDLTGARGLAISNQRETLCFLDAQGASVRPAMVWLDERAIAEIYSFSAAFGRERLHRMTGKHRDLTPAVFRLAWMQEHHPDQLRATAKITDVHSYLCRQLTGTWAASWSSADPSGLFDIVAMDWSDEILGMIGVTRDQLSDLYAPGALVGRVTPAAAAATGCPEGQPVFAGGGDGQCAGLGVNAMQPGTAYLNLGTAIIVGAWAQDPLISRHWRTMTSSTGSGYFLEGVMRAGTFLVDWYVKNFIDPAAAPATFDRLEASAAKLPVGSEGLIVSPYLSGCMNPHWDPAARAAFFNVSSHHTPEHFYRATLEALTGEIARSLSAMQESGVPVDRIFAMGGGANSTLWRQMIADATGLDLIVCKTLEASALGAAMAAAKGLGWYPDFDTCAAAMSETDLTQTSDLAAAEAWAGLLARQDKINHVVCSDLFSDAPPEK